MAEAHYLVLLSTGSPSFRRQKSWVGIRTQRQPVVKIDHSTSQSLVLSDSGYCGQAPLSVSVFIKVNTGTQVPKYLSKVLRSSLNVTDFNWAWYLLGVFARPCLTQVSNSFLNGFFLWWMPRWLQQQQWMLQQWMLPFDSHWKIPTMKADIDEVRLKWKP